MTTCTRGRRCGSADCGACYLIARNPAYAGGLIPVASAAPPLVPPPTRRSAVADGPPPAPAVGRVGTRLKRLLAELGLAESPSCSCEARRRQMDAWGVAGCRTHRAEIEGWLREEAAKVGWVATLRAGAKALAAGLLLNPLDPAPGLLDEAIRRAEADIAPVPTAALAGHFNPAVIEHGGRLLLAARKGRTGSRLYLTWLADDLTPASPPVEVTLDHPLAAGGREDPRLFVHAGRLHLSFIGVRRRNGRVETSVLYARLTDDLRVEEIVAPEYAARRWPMEKNWVFFEDAGELRAIYTVGPHHVVHAHRDGRAVEIATAGNPIRWPWGEPRGGASPVRVGDEWYHWFHGTGKRDGKPYYTAGLYTFDARAPYRPLRWIPEPLLAGDVPNDEGKRVVFPCGAILRNGEWVVSYGWNDVEVRFARFNAAEIESRLVGV